MPTIDWSDQWWKRFSDPISACKISLCMVESKSPSPANCDKWKWEWQWGILFSSSFLLYNTICNILTVLVLLKKKYDQISLLEYNDGKKLSNVSYKMFVFVIVYSELGMP